MVTTVADRAWSDEELDELTARMEREYAQAAREMTEKLNEQMKSYEEGRAEWLERLDGSPELQSEYESWLRSQAARQEYLQDMTSTLATDATNARRKANDAINNTLPRVYAEGANHAAFEIDSALHMRTSFSLVDEDTVRVLMTSQVSVPREMRWNRQHFTSALTQGILQGESVPNVAKRMRNVLGMGYRSSVRAARTALTGAENAGRVASYERAKEMGIGLKQEWLAALDSRTRHSHRLLDGERVEVGKKFSNGCRFPGDPEGLPEETCNCRCTLVVALDDEEEDRLEGRWSKLPDGMTYDEWKHEKLAEASRQERAGVVNGKNILGTWQRRPDQYDFEIEDILAAQGFDGKPRVVSAEEFDEAVKAANNGNGFIAQRVYSAPDQETLDAYREMLYNGKWYVDCSTGGAQYGQGMYCAADYSGTLSYGIEEEMRHYRNQYASLGHKLTKEEWLQDAEAALKDAGLYSEKAADWADIYFDRDRDKARLLMDAFTDDQRHAMNGVLSEVPTYGGQASYTETMTLDPSAKVVSYSDVSAMKDYPWLSNFDKAVRDAGVPDDAIPYVRSRVGLPSGDSAAVVKFRASNPGMAAEFDESDSVQFFRNLARDAEQSMTPQQKAVMDMDVGSYAAAMGYDAINAERHGASGSYTVILNRTKLIIKEP